MTNSIITEPENKTVYFDENGNPLFEKFSDIFYKNEIQNEYIANVNYSDDCDFGNDNAGVKRKHMFISEGCPHSECGGV